MAAPAERAGQGAAGGTGVSVFARQTFRAAGIAAARQPRPFCQSRGSRAGTEARPGTGKLAFAARAAAARHAARHVARRLPPQPDEDEPSRHRLAVQFLLSRPRTGEKARTLRDMIDLVVRATHEQELFPPHDWEFIQWIADTHRQRSDGADTLVLSDAELLQWLARWGHTNRLESRRRTASRCIFTARSSRSRRIWKTATRNFPSRTAFALPGRRKSFRRRREIFQPPAAARARRQHILSCCATRRRAGVLKYLAQQAVRARAQVEPPPAAASAQDAVESRRGLGTALRRAPGRAAVCF